MRLKKLSILGFKSFADKTVLNFDKGITCIVGPNGCGKSNIADAFRWVLGEQSAKSMRGAKMPDVIFAGTSHRKPLNFAEVSLSFTDVQGYLPIDYEEVTITRRLHRNGESEYLLNHQAIRLKDLQTLFLGSGVGRNAFSIFEQGKLDKVIQDSPFERRHIFEEAAGILRFLQRKKEALKRLEQADLNLSRVQDIHAEVEKQIQTLENQAKKARLFKEKKALLQDLEKGALILRWKNLEKKREDIKQRLETQLAKQEESQAEHLKCQAKCQELKQHKQQQEKALRIQNEKLVSLRGEYEIDAREKQSLQTRLKESQLREKKLKQELEDLALNQETRKQQLIEMRKKRERLESEWTEAETEWKEQQKRTKSLEQFLVQLRQDVSSCQKDHLSLVQQHSQLQSEWKQIEVRLENLQEKEKLVQARAQLIKGDGEQLKKQREESKQLLQQMIGLVDLHKERLERLEIDLKAISQEEEKTQQEMAVLQRKGMEIKARQKILVKMRDEHEGFSSGSKLLLQESQNPKSPLYEKLRPFYEFFQPDSEALEAISVVLKGYAQTLIVQTDQDFQEVLSFAKQKELHDYSLFCLEWFKISSSSDQEHSLFEHVTSNEVSRHFLHNVAVCSTHTQLLNNKFKEHVQEGWSQEGIYLDHRGVFFHVKPNENQVFFRESEIKSLEEQENQIENQLQEMQKAYQHLQHRRSHMKMEWSEVDKTLRRDEMKLVEVNARLQRVLSDYEKNQADWVVCEKEEKELKDNLEQHSALRSSLDKKCQEAQDNLNRLQEKKGEIEQELSQQEKIWRIQEGEQKEKEKLYQQLGESKQQMLHESRVLEMKEEDHEKHLERIQEELDEIEERKSAILQVEKEKTERIGALEELVQEATAVYTEMEKKVELLGSEVENAELQWNDQRNEERQLEGDVAQAQMQLAHQEALLQSVRKDFYESYDSKIEESLDTPLPVQGSLDQMEKQIKGVKLAIQECGDVNLTAIDELEKHQQRYSFLRQQVQDMQQSKGELLGMIGQLDGESHKLFQETFEAIRVNFKKNFQILFNGGEADLELTDPKQILESGIEISARPPGKQMRSMSLLSGGEKCLTAVALLFAIFEVKPSPFCVLDEIDAPLDDTNVERFVNVVKHFVDRCQFLIITHNKRTMAIGDVLFGVSMEEKGVSKLLSLAFAHREAPEAILVT